MPGSPSPTPFTERILFIDVLRGVALLGVVVVHANFFAADVSTQGSVAGPWINAGLDRWADRAVRVLVEEKAQTIFAVLFGVSFALQWVRLQDRVSDPARVYRRRLLGLLLIGCLHAVLLPMLDILAYFALSGFVLLVVRKWSARSLACVGLLLSLVVMPTAHLIGPDEAGTQVGHTLGNLHLPAVLQYGSYLDILEQQWPLIWFVGHPVRSLLTFGVYVLGRLMLGAAIWKAGLVTDPVRHARALRYAAVIGVPVGILLIGARKLEIFALKQVGWTGSARLWDALATYLHQAGTLVLAGSLAAVLLLAWQSKLWKALLSVFVPVGRMAVTNYLLQSVAISLVFFGFGFGLLGRLGSAWCLALAFGIFSLQCLFSFLWLRVFRFGPVEWAWRGWTYGSFAPLRRTPGVEPQSR